jgi:hypothetical protein
MKTNKSRAYLTARLSLQCTEEVRDSPLYNISQYDGQYVCRQIEHMVLAPEPEDRAGTA